MMIVASLNQAYSKVDFKCWGNELVALVSTDFLAPLAADKMSPSLTFFFIKQNGGGGCVRRIIFLLGHSLTHTL